MPLLLLGAVATSASPSCQRLHLARPGQLTTEVFIQASHLATRSQGIQSTCSWGPGRLEGDGKAQLPFSPGTGWGVERKSSPGLSLCALLSCTGFTTFPVHWLLLTSLANPAGQQRPWMGWDTGSDKDGGAPFPGWGVVRRVSARVDRGSGILK